MAPAGCASTKAPQRRCRLGETKARGRSYFHCRCTRPEVLLFCCRPGCVSEELPSWRSLDSYF
eukprot:10263228-Alexandrium_andersonii.AAC.1